MKIYNHFIINKLQLRQKLKSVTAFLLYKCLIINKLYFYENKADRYTITHYISNIYIKP